MPNVYIKKPHYKQEIDSSCVPTCLRMMFEFFGIKVSESELRKKLKTKSFGTHVINIINITDEDYGIHTDIEFWSLTELKYYLKTFKRPCMVMLWTEHLTHWDIDCLHSVIVNGFDDNNVIINDPYFNQDEFHIPFEAFLKSWQLNDGLVILFHRSDDKK
ncbi:MAG: cysteine peptidase family C39 domain-containing protein [bacterium]|nr:cysteine peptidase family C39 domain-containing protein [bacterium]